MRIKCPECRSVLSLGHPKQGRYRPECKHCHQTFLLQVSDDEPPRIKSLRQSATGNEATMNASAEIDATTDFSLADSERTGPVPRTTQKAAEDVRGDPEVDAP